MTNAYFVPLITMPSVVVEPGNYITRSGDVVTISVASTHHDLGCEGNYADGARESWHKSGRVFATRETANDIVHAA